MDDLMSLDSQDFSYPSLLPLSSPPDINPSQPPTPSGAPSASNFNSKRREAIVRLSGEDIILKLVEADRRLFEAVSLFISVEASNGSSALTPPRGRPGHNSRPASPMNSEPESSGSHSRQNKRSSIGPFAPPTIPHRQNSLGTMFHLRGRTPTSPSVDSPPRQRWGMPCMPFSILALRFRALPLQILADTRPLNLNKSTSRSSSN
ncbi:hypothetical protein BT69DRAFT_602053 [Atractiella rhizophila]|nr:hypothetical protein BT69DRAFT_602053 [Atractiella rhizophila]